MPEKEIRISAKNLAAINMPDHCPRCFWLKHHHKLPWQIFPGIFMSIDSYTKKAIHAWFDIYGSPPSSWIPELAEADRYLKAPHWSKFKRFDEITGLTLSGGVDDLFETKDLQHIIPDYKTAKYTANQDKLHPLYAGQLNGYRWIDEGMGHKVHSLPLIYFEPVTDEYACTQEIFTGKGINMGFTAHVVMVEMDDNMIPNLLVKAAEIINLESPPSSADGCKDCESFNQLLQLF